ncbi:5-formyltetrahydrofolate cyclo-ligase-like [Amphiura filiformis]|uniref:5-formyltetrahydrofolate cyclo-ligase-like n=1 Tax=Amphiura filiformis TaxID=82378 RepID=UPI003B2249E0
MAAIRQAKKLLRLELKKRLQALSDADKTRQADFITNKLINHPIYRQSKRISVYLSMPEEVGTDQILRHIFANNKTCFIPQYIGPRMNMLKLNSMEDFETLPKTKWNIKQPAEGDDREEALSTGGLDLIIIPGLGFSRSGDRLGRGMGYYDSYQRRCTEHTSGKPHTIALAFKEQMCDSIPTTDDDITIDHVLFGE